MRSASTEKAGTRPLPLDHSSGSRRATPAPCLSRLATPRPGAAAPQLGQRQCGAGQPGQAGQRIAAADGKADFGLMPGISGLSWFSLRRQYCWPGGQRRGEFGVVVGATGDDRRGRQPVRLGKQHVEGDGGGAQFGQPGARSAPWCGATRAIARWQSSEASSISRMRIGRSGASRGRNCWKKSKTGLARHPQRIGIGGTQKGQPRDDDDAEDDGRKAPFPHEGVRTDWSLDKRNRRAGEGGASVRA